MQLGSHHIWLASIFFSGLVSARALGLTVTSESLSPLLAEGNPQVKAALIEWRASLNKSGSLARSFMPSISAKGHLEKSSGDVVGGLREPIGTLEVTSNLYNAQHDQIDSEISKLEIERLKISFDRIAIQELEKAQELYWQIIYLHEKKSLITNMIGLNQKNLKSALSRIENGVATQSDRFEFEMKIVDLQRDLAMVDSDLVSNEVFLKLLLGIGQQIDLQISGTLEHVHEGVDAFEAETGPVDIFFAEYELIGKQHALSARALRQSWEPKIDLFAAYNRYDAESVTSPSGVRAESDESSRGETVFGVRMSMNLQVASNSYYDADSYIKRAEAARIRGDFARREAKSHLDRELKLLRILHDQVHGAGQNIARAEIYYKLTSAEYARGVKNSPDVLGAAVKLQEVRMKYLEIIKDYEISRSHVTIKAGLSKISQPAQ